MPMRAWVLAVLLCPSPVAALSPYLVRDIDPSGIGAGSKPAGFASLGSRAIFFADGRELWSSDGEGAGTFRLTGEEFVPEVLGVGARIAFFSANDPAGHPLWATDGTAAGTRRLTPFAFRLDGRARRRSRLVVPGSDRFFFAAESAAHGIELWTSDGTPEGTREVANLATGRAGSAPHELTLWGGRVYFLANDGRGLTLWSTDGTASGTRDEGLDPAGRPEGDAGFLTVAGANLYFFLREPDGWSLWKSDGGARSPVRVVRFASGGAGARAVIAIGDAIARAGRLYFVARDGAGSWQVWVSDGSAPGTRRLSRFSGASSTAEQRFPPQPAGSALLFAAVDGAHGREPWTSDGTASGTRRLRDLCPGACSGWVDSARAATFAVGVVFPAFTPGRGTELWITKGAAALTRLLFDACRGACSGSPDPLGSAGGKLYFAAFGGLREQVWRTDGSAAGTVRVSDFADSPGAGERFAGAAAGALFLFDGIDAIRGRELWRTDGSRPGTRLVADLVPNRPGSSSPQELRRAGSRLLFLADAGDGPGLWASDGTEEGTREIVAATGPGSPFLLSGASTGDRFTYFYRVQNGVYDLWRSDGTAAGTWPITPPGVRIETSQAVQVFGDLGYFTAEEDDRGEELWRTDGTREGTRRVADVDPGPAGSQPDRFASFLGHLVFEARVGGDLVLYASDGTEEGTRPLAEAFPFLEGARLLDVETEGIALYQRNDAQGQAEIWATDGTGAGSRLLGGLTHLSDFSASDGRFLFRAGTSFESQKVYFSEGTSAGTRAIATDLSLRSDLVRLRRIGDRFVFSASRLDDPSHPAVWISDGSPAGTYPLLATDLAADQPRGATPFGGRLLLAGGARLWSTDGTADGTVVEAETENGAQAPQPVVAGERAFYPWTTAETGTELWALRPE